MASEAETVDEVLRCMQNDIVHFVGKPVKHSRDLLQDYASRIEAAHGREVAELRRRLKVAEEALEKLQTICRQTEYVYGRVICDNAIAAIRGEGVAK